MAGQDQELQMPVSLGGDTQASAGEAVFFGEYEHTIDDKNRLTLNSTLRMCVPADEQERGFVLTRGQDACLALYTVSTFQRVAARMGEATSNDPNKRAYMRDFFRKMTLVKCDVQGRIVLPPDLRKVAHLRKDCVEVGVRNHMEIWAKELYDAYWTLHPGAAEQGGEEMPF